ncbi:alpha/beta fold hydrolase [Actinoplanes subtropicus]|uniref:alpha/beta fold hydrolase n=1 Tax=Actinoplanes subtropicus TaxID=543632 RepID=UPI0004C317DC|nr:alpha/beta hydrolase [Actinoplanes subtropicus]
MRTMVDGVATYPSGTGGPSVPYLPGAGLVGLDFLNLTETPGAAHLLYDRGGTGWSDPVPLPRSAASVARELDRVAGPGPHVLVGHSMGAVYARRFAQIYMDKVAGMLLLDPGHEDLFDYLPPEAAALNDQMKPDPTEIPDLSPEQHNAALAAWRRMLAAWPDGIREELAAHHVEHWRTGLAESANLESEVYGELRRGGPVPDIPTIVLSAGAGNPAWSSFGSPDLVRRALDGIRELHAGMAKAATRGEHRVLEGATHQFLHLERPDEVRGALRDLLAALQ